MVRIEKNRLGQLKKKSSVEKRLREEMFPKIKKPRLGMKHTEETKNKIREKTMGVNNPNYGIKKSIESKNKTSESLKRYWENKNKLCQK